MAIASRVYDTLRSRRLAVVLLAALAVWAGLATLVPQGGAAGTAPSAAIPRWLVGALGLDHAFSSPVFVGLAALLFCSTVACSLERSKSAVRLWRRAGRDARSVSATRRWDFTVQAHDAEDAAALVNEAFRTAGLSVRVATDEMVFATSPRFGVWGSPAFHWLLALLVAIIAAGQLTRAEGMMGVPIGSSRIDARDSYGVVSEGPLHKRFSALTIAVPSLALTHMVGGIDRGPAPYVELYDGTERIAAGYVFPNHPLRYKSLVIHPSDIGLAVTLVAPDGTTIDALLDFDESGCVARSVSALEAAGPGGVTRIDLSIPLDRVEGRCATALPRAPRIEWVATGPAGRLSGEAAPKERFEPVPGFTVTVGSVGYYARLSVVDDWSVYPMYAVFVLAAIALAVALFVPYREAAAFIESGPAGTVVRVRARHSRRDPAFAQRIQQRVERTLCVPSTPREEIRE